MLYQLASPGRDNVAVLCFGLVFSRLDGGGTGTLGKWLPRQGEAASGLFQLIHQRAIVVFPPEFRSCDNGAAAHDSEVTSY